MIMICGQHHVHSWGNDVSYGFRPKLMLRAAVWIWGNSRNQPVKYVPDRPPSCRHHTDGLLFPDMNGGIVEKPQVVGSDNGDNDDCSLVDWLEAENLRIQATRCSSNKCQNLLAFLSALTCTPASRVRSVLRSSFHASSATASCAGLRAGKRELLEYSDAFFPIPAQCYR